MGQKLNSSGMLSDFAFPTTDKHQAAISECINKIMNTLSFRKLAGKTQVILSLAGPDVRTRLTHTIEVAKIARDICNRLVLNADLAEAIALAHDIGHTPFGHVGERTLREIMCGCDTLRGKVNDFDFANSGFRHNLQSFRVLNNFEQITKNNKHKNIWPYILWGALAHSKMTWSKSYSGMEDEILISSKHCDWVYVCHYDEKKECKRNIQRKKGKEAELDNKEICKPWYCANLPVVSNKYEVAEKDLANGETTREYIKREPIKKEYLKHIFCSYKCYLAKLWKHKMENYPLSLKYPYLYDHPFPNSFYAKCLYNFFFNNSGTTSWIDHITVEAQIVNQADEIAQRQQDLEDGISKGLLYLEDAQKQIKELIEPFKNDSKIKDLYSEIYNKKKPDELGKLLVSFYSQLIVTGSTQNFAKFENESKVETLNIYSLMNLLYSMSGNFPRKSKWLLQELNTAMIDNITKKAIKEKIVGGKIFTPDFEIGYLYLLSYDHLENCGKKIGYSKYLVLILNKYIHHLQATFYVDKKRKLLPKDKIGKAQDKLQAIEESLKHIIEIYSKIVKIKKIKRRLEKINKPSPFKNHNNHICVKVANYFIDNCPNDLNYLFIIALNNVRSYLEIVYKNESNIFFREKDKTPWKNLGTLNLPQFYTLFRTYNKYFRGNNKIFCTKDIGMFDYKTEGYNQEATFNGWKKIVKDDAHKVLKNLVEFVFEDDQHKKRKEDELKNFKEKQGATILKSEPVEKNDGKASYILTRLFKAYISNSHQLPDSGLKSIVVTLQERSVWSDLKNDEHKTFIGILKNLKKTMLDGDRTDKKIKEIQFADFSKIARPSNSEKLEKLKNGASNEIQAALDNRWKLYKFFWEIEKNKKDILKWLNSEEYDDRKSLNGILRKFRANLDNPFLNPTPFWKSILTRGICDYIAGMTDQEAINEYEKLYAGIMELA